MSSNDLEVRIQRLEDLEEIKKLQSTYQHLLHMYDWEGIVDLFAKKAPDISAEIGDSGLFVGAVGVKRFFTGRMPSPRRGRKGTLLLHLALNPVIEVSKDGKTANGLWHGPGIYFGTDSGSPEADITLGKYSCGFIKEDGKWQFRHLKWFYYARIPNFWKQKSGEEGVGKSLGDAYAAYQPDKPGTIPPGYDQNKEDNCPQPPLPKPMS
ncbi:nuclear transport factor 2 family protein [Chloroflexota bacterium]